MDGIDLFGPFINEEAAHAWVRAHGDSEAIDVYGNAKESHWFVKHLCIPRHWEAISDAEEEA
jgi:hypothetical protein